MVFDVLFEELIDDLVITSWVQITIDTVLFLIQSRVGFLEIVNAGVLADEVVALIPIVVPGLLDQEGLKFLLVYPLRLHTDFDDHFNYLLKIKSLN
jgi:hypothetical protein